MVQWKTIFFLLATSAALAVFGCPGSHSIFSASRGATAVGSATGKSSGTTTSEARGTLGAAGAKHVWRDSTFSVYHNPDYGVTFRYPRNFALQEQAEAGDSDSDAAPAAQAQQQLTAEQPGALLVATVSIPSDAYPNTTFQSGALQFVVHPLAKAESCQALATPLGPVGNGASGIVSIQEIPFTWREQSSSDADTRYVQREYAGYARGACYEFRMEVGVSGGSDTDAGIKAADTKKILRTLEKIVLSLQLHQAAAAADRASTTSPATGQ
jgi:hypothetical protein